MGQAMFEGVNGVGCCACWVTMPSGTACLIGCHTRAMPSDVWIPRWLTVKYEPALLKGGGQPSGLLLVLAYCSEQDRMELARANE